MADVSLVDADAVALTLPWLRSHAKVLSAFGGAEHVSGLREAPWPHLQVTDGVGGDFGNGIGDPLVEVVDLTVWGAPDGSVGEAAMRRLIITACEAMVDLQFAPYTPGQPAVSRVRVTSINSQALTNGQRRRIAAVQVTMRPQPAPAP